MGLQYMGNGRAQYIAIMPRPHTSGFGMSPTPQPIPQPQGFGSRSIWPLLPVGEAQRRDPHVPDPVPLGNLPLNDQRNASPAVPHVGQFGAGGGGTSEGLYATVVYVKQLGSLITRSLSRNLLMGVIDAHWRLGGVGYPPETITGPGTAIGAPGYHGDSTSVDPGNTVNRQVSARNPGIKPMVGVPASYRYAPVFNNALYGQYQGKVRFGRPSTAI